MLVLSKLDWDVNFVIALDYLEPLNSLLSTSENLPQASALMETNELKNLICTLSKRYTTFRAIYTARIVACSALNLMEKPEILETMKLTLENDKSLLEKELSSSKQALLKSHKKEINDLKKEEAAKNMKYEKEI